MKDFYTEHFWIYILTPRCFGGLKPNFGLYQPQRPNQNSLFRTPQNEGFVYEFDLVKISGFRDHSRVSRSGVLQNQRVNIYLIEMNIGTLILGILKELQILPIIRQALLFT